MADGIIDEIKKRLARIDEEIREAAEELRCWESMTEEDFQRLVSDMYRRNLHAPHSLQSETEYYRIKLERLKAWEWEARRLVDADRIYRERFPPMAEHRDAGQASR